MDTARDLACPALWQESLERSLARRGRPTRSSLELSHLRAERDLSRPDLLRESLTYSQLRRSAATRRPSMAVPGAGGISALALLAATTLPGLVGGGRSAAGHHADATDARLANAPVAGLAIDPSLSARASVTEATAAPTSATNAQSAAASEPAHVVLPQTVAPARHTVRAATPATAPSRHIALAHDAASVGVSRSAAHALSGGSPTAPQLAAAPRVPAEPQPIGHPSTGGGAVGAAAHSRAATHLHAATHVTSPTHVTAPTHVAAPTHVHVPTHIEATTHSTGAASPQPTSTPHPVTSTHPVAKPHPVSTTKPAPKDPAPAPVPEAPGHYENPLADANVTPERIDQGVDYSGSGTLGAIGSAKVTYVATSGTGWPGAFVEYQLTDGADAGRYVYYAEGVSPAAGLHVGETLQAGQPVAEITPGSSSGIEIGWGSGVGTQPAAQADGQWSGGDDSGNYATPDGKSFSALIASLGGPPGKDEG
ncbi:MAG: hypothetical protein JO130_05225 [Solirubrobacterales bacterium]|nr:hypothetical protein [Solirubrobacterales bacterium]